MGGGGGGGEGGGAEFGSHNLWIAQDLTRPKVVFQHVHFNIISFFVSILGKLIFDQNRK